MKCNDCGRRDNVPADPRRMRQDVCDECWPLRLEFIKAIRPHPSYADFQREAQRLMNGRSGRAAAYMRGVLETMRANHPRTPAPE